VQTLSRGEQADPSWRVREPPPGFELRSARRLGDSVQLLYSDGLASVSGVHRTGRRQPARRIGDATGRGERGIHVGRDGRRIVAIARYRRATVDYFAHQAQAVAG
jgi:sigma-E factor negative regulatory protein RseB